MSFKINSLIPSSWNKNNKKYIELFSHIDNYPCPYTETIIPTFVDIITRLTTPNDKILDLGCGQGHLARIISKLRPNICGCDLSAEMISEAEKYPSSIKYWVQNLEVEMPPVSQKFKLLYTNLVLMYINNLDQFLTNASNYLDDNGYLIICMSHPCYYHDNNYNWFQEEEGVSYKVVNYLKERRFNKVIANKYKTIHIHRTLSTYLNTFINHHFKVVEVREPQPRLLLNNLLKKSNKIPSDIFIVLQKQS